MAADRFREGDTVVLKKDLIKGILYGGFYCTCRMLDETEGKLLKIEHVYPGCYKIDRYDSPFFTDEMLEPAYIGTSDWNYKQHIDAPFKLKIKTKRIKFNFNN